MCSKLSVGRDEQERKNERCLKIKKLYHNDEEILGAIT